MSKTIIKTVLLLIATLQSNGSIKYRNGIGYSRTNCIWLWNKKNSFNFYLTKQMMNNKDLIEKKKLSAREQWEQDIAFSDEPVITRMMKILEYRWYVDTDRWSENTFEDDVRPLFEKMLHISTTTESKEVDGEWIEKLLRNFEKYWEVFTIHKTTLKRLITDNPPKTNDKRIDELIEKYSKEVKEMKEDRMWWEIEYRLRNKLEVVIQDLTILKSPTVPKDGWCENCKRLQKILDWISFSM